MSPLAITILSGLSNFFAWIAICAFVISVIAGLCLLWFYIQDSIQTERYDVFIAGARLTAASIRKIVAKLLERFPEQRSSILKAGEYIAHIPLYRYVVPLELVKIKDIMTELDIDIKVVPTDPSKDDWSGNSVVEPVLFSAGFDFKYRKHKYWWVWFLLPLSWIVPLILCVICGWFVI